MIRIIVNRISTLFIPMMDRKKPVGPYIAIDCAAIIGPMLAPILISFSRSVVSDQCSTASGTGSDQRLQGRADPLEFHDLRSIPLPDIPQADRATQTTRVNLDASPEATTMDEPLDSAKAQVAARPAPDQEINP